MSFAPAPTLFARLRRHSAAAVVVALLAACLPLLRIYGAELAAGDAYWRALSCLSAPAERGADSASDAAATAPCGDDCLACLGAGLAQVLHVWRHEPAGFRVVEARIAAFDPPAALDWRRPPARAPPIG